MVVLAILLVYPIFFPIFSATPAVVINEIMYDPAQADPCDDSKGEWVELKNPDSTAPLTMTNWSVKDATTTSRSFSGEIAVNGYALLVSNKSCFLQNHPGVSESLIIDLNAKIGSGLNNSNGTGAFADQVWIFDESGSQVAMVEYSDESGEGRSLALVGGSWEEANPTPGEENVSGQEESDPSPQPESERVISFSSRASVVAGAEFTVTVNLMNFEAGTYALKVLVGKGDEFYDGETKGVNGEWFDWNSSWADFPKVTFNSPGSKSKPVLAMVDKNASAGNYLVFVSVAKKKSDGKYSALWTIGELEKNPLAVSAAPAVSEEVSVSGTTGDSGDFGNTENPYAATPSSEEGQVLGEEVPQDKGFQLNFYIFVGILGLIVGSGGLVLGFRYLKNSSVAVM